VNTTCLWNVQASELLPFRTKHSKSTREMDELKQQLAQSERQLDVCRMKLLNLEKNRDSASKQPQVDDHKLHQLLNDNQVLARQLAEAEGREKTLAEQGRLCHSCKSAHCCRNFTFQTVA